MKASVVGCVLAAVLLFVVVSGTSVEIKPTTTVRPTPTANHPTTTAKPTPTHTQQPTTTVRPTPTHTQHPTVTAKPISTHTPKPTTTHKPTPTHTQQPTTTHKPTPTPTPQPTTTPYQFVLDGYAPYVNLDCNENLIGLDYGVDFLPWNTTSGFPMGYNGVTQWLSNYQSEYTTVFSQYYANLLRTVDITPDNEICVNNAISAYEQAYNENGVMLPYNITLNPSQWAQQYNAGVLNQNVFFKSSFYDNGPAIGYVSSDTLVRVDIKPTNWFNEGLFWSVRDSNVTDDVFCSNNSESVYDCFFDPDYGKMNSMITGFVVVSGCQREIYYYFKNENSTTTCDLNTPYVVAWIIKQVPERNPWC